MTGRRSGWMWSLPGKSGASNSDYGGFWMNKLEFQVHVLYRAFHLNMVRFIYLPESETILQLGVVVLESVDLIVIGKMFG